MSYPCVCYGCEHYEGIAPGDPGTSYCGISGRKMAVNGKYGCDSFKPDSQAGCVGCYYKLGGPPGPICDKGLASMSSGGHKSGYCYGFAKAFSESDIIAEKSGCFVTEAACSFSGLPDDCHFLSSLREFRDQVLMKSPEWEPLVHEYYRIAPVLLQKIEASGKSEIIYRKLIQDFLPALSKASGTHREHEARITRYQEMIRWIDANTST